MSRGPARFTEADLRRAIKAAKREGAGAIEIKPDGTIQVSISPNLTGEQETGVERGNISLETASKLWVSWKGAGLTGTLKLKGY